jgi:hypothetical protein
MYFHIYFTRNIFLISYFITFFKSPQICASSTYVEYLGCSHWELEIADSAHKNALSTCEQDSGEPILVWIYL